MNDAQRTTYLSVGHERAAHVWLWDGAELHSWHGARTHRHIWGDAVERHYRGRFDGQTLTIIVPSGRPKGIVPQRVLDMLESAFGTATEVLYFD